MSSLWQKVWDERGEKYPSDNPMSIDGFDQSFGSVSTQTLKEICSQITKKLELSSVDVLFELGCGVGVLLNLLLPHVKDCYGTDLSLGMIQRARRLYPGLKLQQAQSTALPFKSESFHKILVHSVVQYFSDYDYAEKVVRELVRVGKKGSKILISDVMDEEKKEAYLKIRDRFSSAKSGIWKSSVRGELKHLYYKKDYFYKLADKLALNCSVEDRNVSGYMNADFRFDVLFSK